MNTNKLTIREQIRKELDRRCAWFHLLLATLSKENFQRQSLNPGWTNGEIVVHMMFGFIVINVLLPLARL